MWPSASPPGTSSHQAHVLQTDNGGAEGLGKTGAELSFRTVTRRVLTVTEPSNGFVRSARRTGGSGLGSRRELCEVELVPVDGGREIEHGGYDQAEQSVAEAERGPSGDEQN